MVAEPWILKMGNQVSNNLKHALLLEASNKRNAKRPERPKETIGILSFEVANVMSKTVYLHKSLTDLEMSKLKNETLKSEGVRKLVSSDESYLLELALAEKLDDLNHVAAVASRLGKRCSVPALQGFEHVYSDVTTGVIDVRELGFLVKNMDGMIRKMERYVTSTSNLYAEMEVLNELEEATKKFQQNHHEESRRAFEQKLLWQRQDVRHLRDVSLWNQTYDKITGLLARTICTVYARICIVFGDSVSRLEFPGLSVSGSDGSAGESSSPVQDESRDISSQVDAPHHLQMASGPLKSTSRNCRTHNSGSLERGKAEKTSARSGLATQRSDVVSFHHDDSSLPPCGASPGRLFMDCLSLSSSASRIDDYIEYEQQNGASSGCCSTANGLSRELPHSSGCSDRVELSVPSSVDQRQSKCSMISSRSRFDSKSSWRGS
uniref:DUF3475 domain-containing protein n=1 Tax=Nelumbo nucifera TaxID=4432 RepID=A0A822YX26_NELNU|nr:TPA_asm: hypothetical protein HUJ06_007374 [Nelumbo nucifera]